MDKLNIPANATSYIEALRELIRTDAMASPALESSRLIELPIVFARSGPNPSPAKRAHTFIKVLQQIVHHRLEGKDAQAPGILFGLEKYAGVPVQDGYRTVAKLYSPYWTWKNYRKEPLTRHLLAVYLTLQREAELSTIPPHFGNQPKPAQSGLIGQDWVLESFEGMYTFPVEPGQPLEVIQTRRLRAISKQADVWRHQVHWREGGVPTTPQVSLFGPGSVSVTDDHFDKSSGLRVFITEARFPKPLSYGEFIEFTLHKLADVKHEQIMCDDGQDWFGLLPLSSSAEHVRIGLRFPLHKQPRLVWCHQDIMSGLT